jgi:hypothetical protein
MRSQVRTYNVCGLAEDLLVNLPIQDAILEPHFELDKLAFIFEDVMVRKEIEGESGAGILICDGRLVGFTIINFSHFQTQIPVATGNPEVLFMDICLVCPDFAGDLYRLIGAFEMNQI